MDDYEQNYEPNPEEQLTKKYHIDVSDMPDGLHHLFILPFRYTQIDANKNQGIKPYIFTYREHDLTLEEVLRRYEKDIKFQPNPKKDRCFTLRVEALNKKSTLKDLQKLLGREDIGLDGMFFFIHEFDHYDPDQDQYMDQCCMADYLTSNSHEFGKKSDLNIRFQLSVGKNSPEILNFKLNFMQRYNQSLSKFLVEVHKKYGVMLTLDDVQSSKVKRSKLILKLGDNLLQQKVYKDETITVRIKKDIKLKKINIKNYNSYLLIYKEGEVDPLRIKYDEISDMLFRDLYKQHLELNQSKMKIDAIYCLLIMDMIIKPEQPISKAEDYFRHTQENKTVNIVGKVVNEKMIFYKTIPLLSRKTQFGLDKFNIPKNQEHKRQSCRKKTQEKAMIATHTHFKNNAKNVQPIMIYTTQLMHIEPTTKKEEVIYVSLNKYLREAKILTLNENQVQKEWRLHYASTLLKHLSNIPNFQGQTFRGISFDPKIQKVGQILTFKQFTSTSLKLQVALKFAKKYGQQPYHILNFKVLTGKSIIEYSQYTEGEILLEPYSQFEVKSIKDDVLKGKKCKVYYLEEIETPRQLPNNKANFIVWIDDKSGDEQKIFDSIKSPKQTVLLQKIGSTAQFKNWLDKNEKLLSDPTANVIFITNMARKQVNRFNEIAGINAAKLIRSKSKYKHYPVYFYIGDVKKAEQKLRVSEIDMKNITVGNSFAALSKYILQSINTYDKL